ncbi:hypothetical protein PS15p_204236 [Mucor circinelloides]
MSSQHHNTSPHENEHTVFDALIPPIEKLSDCFNGLHRQFDKLKQVNDNLVEFNDSFSAFLFGIAANDTTVKWRSLTTESDITKHKKYLNQLHTHEATKAVQVVTQPTPPSPLPTTTHTTATTATTTTSATALPSSSTSATALPRPVHKRNAIVNLPGNTRKKPKTVKEIPKQLVSNRRFEPKVNVKNIINRLPIKYQDRGPPNEHMSSVLKILGLHPEGLTARKLSSETRLAQRFITDCINTLVFRKEVIKIQEQGEYARYLFDPARFPSVPK